MGNNQTYWSVKLKALFDYLEGKIKGRERNAFERNMEKDPFEAAAMEGFEKVSREEAAADLQLLSDKLASRVSQVERRRTPWYGIAAAVASIMVVSTLFLVMNDGGMKKLETLPEMQEAGREAAEEKAMPSPEIENRLEGEEMLKEDETGTAETASEFGKSSETGSQMSERAKKGIKPGDTPEIADIETDVESDIQIGNLSEEDAAKTRKSVAVSEAVHIEEINTELADESLTEMELISEDPINGVKIFQEQGNAATNDQVKGETAALLTESPAATGRADTSPRQLFAKSTIQDTGEKGNAKIRKNLTYDNSTAMNANEMQNIDSQQQKTMAHQTGMTMPASTAAVTEPMPVGGFEAYQVYLDSALVLPDTLDQKSAQIVKLQFNISPEGKPSDFQILHSPEKILSEKAIEVIEEGPRWKPALENGSYIKSDIVLEVTFSHLK